jgi:hypothetical protein
MNSDFIEDHELLYRAVPKFPKFWKNDNKSVSSALFKNCNGVSVDRDGKRTEDNICSLLQKRIANSIAVAKLIASEARQVDVYLHPKPSKSNHFHAEIHESRNHILISNSKAKKLSNLVKLIWFKVAT